VLKEPATEETTTAPPANTAAAQETATARPANPNTLTIAPNPNGSLTVGSDNVGNEVVALGDPSTGSLELIEIPKREGN
jgi:hypothetical protein